MRGSGILTLLAFVGYFVISGITFDWCLWSLFAKDIPSWADVLCGIFLGEITIPLGIVLWIISFFIQVPLFP